MVRRFQFMVLIVALVTVSPALSNGNDIRLLKNNSVEYQGQTMVLSDIAVPIATAQCQAGNKKWPCGATATLRFNELLKMPALSCEIEFERDNIAVTRCNYGDRDLAHQLLSEGWALTLSDKAEYWQAETHARSLNLGIWRGGFSPPPDWRQYPETALDPYLDLACSVCADRKQSSPISDD